MVLLLSLIVRGNTLHAATFFEQRLIVAGTINNPTTVYGSVVADFENFTVDSTKDDYEFEFKLALHSGRWNTLDDRSE